MEEIKRKQEIERWHEKDRLFQFDEVELSKQPRDVQYTRMRYEREIEAYEFVRMLKYMPREKAVIEARNKAYELVSNWNTVKKHPNTWI